MKLILLVCPGRPSEALTVPTRINIFQERDSWKSAWPKRAHEKDADYATRFIEHLRLHGAEFADLMEYKVDTALETVTF